MKSFKQLIFFSLIFMILFLISCLNLENKENKGSYNILSRQNIENSIGFVKVYGYTIIKDIDSVSFQTILINNQYYINTDKNGFYTVYLNPDCYNFQVFLWNELNIKTDTICFDSNESINIDFYYDAKIKY